MPGTPLLDPDAEPLRAVVDRGGRVNNLYRSLANQPVLLEAWTRFAWTLRSECATPRTLRELLILRAVQIAGSDYIREDHVEFGLEAGVPQAKIDALEDWRRSPVYDDAERAALEFTDQLIRSGRVDDATLADVESRFPPAEVVELALTVAFYAMAPRVVEALRVPLRSAGR